MANVSNGIRNWLLEKTKECEVSFFSFASSLQDGDDLIQVSRSFSVMEHAEPAIFASARASIFSAYIAYYDRRKSHGDSERDILDGIGWNVERSMVNSSYDAGKLNRGKVAEMMEDGKRQAWAEIRNAVYNATVVLQVKDNNNDQSN